MLQQKLTPKSKFKIGLAIVLEATETRSSDRVETEVTEILQTLVASQTKFTYEIITIDIANLYLLERKSYDAVLLYDWQNKSRSKLAGWLKVITKEKNIPIIIIEETLSEERVKEYQKLGITEMISKDNIQCLPEQIESSLLKKQFSRQKEPVARLVRKEKKRKQLLYNIGKKINSALDREQVLEYIISAVGKTFNLERALVFSQIEPEITILKQWRANQEIKDLELAKMPSQGQENPNVAIERAIARELEKESAKPILSAPLYIREKYYGSLILQRIERHQIFILEEIQTIETIAELSAIVLDKIATEAKITKIEAEKEAALAADRLKSEFIAHISHEFRNPLTAIMGFARMLGEEIYGNLNNKQMQYVNAISASGNHLLELINDLLDLAKIEADREEIYLEPVPLEEVCLASISMVQELAAQKDLELKLVVEPSVSFCRADRRRLKQILVNLLSNAVKFTEAGGVTLQVKENDRTIQFNVIDTGIGIDPANCAKIFEPFIQIKTHLSKKYKGTGLGLPLSAKLANLHGGNLTVTSAKGKGSCFTLSLPK